MQTKNKVKVIAVRDFDYEQKFYKTGDVLWIYEEHLHLLLTIEFCVKADDIDTDLNADEDVEKSLKKTRKKKGGK